MSQLPDNVDLSRFRDFYNAGILRSFVVMPSIIGRYNLFAVLTDGRHISVLTARGKIKEYKTIDTVLKELVNITGSTTAFHFRPK